MGRRRCQMRCLQKPYLLGAGSEAVSGVPAATLKPILPWERLPRALERRSAISTAVLAQSTPWLCPPCERATACSCVLHVSTPKTTGVAVCRPTSISPFATVLEITSKCVVSPSIRQPIAMITSVVPESASSREASGSSKAPGTLVSKMFSAGTFISRRVLRHPSSSAPVMSSFQRECTIATRTVEPSSSTKLATPSPTICAPRDGAARRAGATTRDENPATDPTAASASTKDRIVLANTKFRRPATPWPAIADTGGSSA
mmetsp:Transcript_3280/g.8181  ORF Transcript_3280/g.8181 Transcript_3280/m.8181 type:complete len:260 (-) Transcript_3280:1341-2120(-)